MGTESAQIAKGETDVQWVEFPTREAEQELVQHVADEVDAALELHASLEKKYSRLYRGYKALPEQEKKDFPWPNASNVVVPLIAITVDAIVARLMRGILGAQDFAEVQIKDKVWEPFEKDIRDWVNYFVHTSGARDRLRTGFFDMTLYGDSFIKPIFVHDTRVVHQYDTSGNVLEQEITKYRGVRWHIADPRDIIHPHGFDEWDDLPWFGERLRYTRYEVARLEAEGYFRNGPLEGVKKVLKLEKPRDDQRLQDQEAAEKVRGTAPNLITLYEIYGMFPVPGSDPGLPTQYRELILTYSHDARAFVRAIYNPFFGFRRHLSKIPYLRQGHELRGMSAAEQVEQAQIEASTIHNQVIDAATAANAGVFVASPETDFGRDQRIWPGKVIVDENPERLRVLHLNQPSPVLGNMEQVAVRYGETRSGVSSYHLGMESTIVGSQATATGTTALIREGNTRFWVSIDDMRTAIVDLIYDTITLIQQFQPEGVQISDSRLIQFPQGDVRTAIGLTIAMSSESVNRDIELQNMQLLMAVLNEYYSRLMQASAMFLNPQFPQEQKNMILQVMTASNEIIRRFVERFSIEDIDKVVPNLLTALQGAGVPLNGPSAQSQVGIQPMGGVPPAGPAPAPASIPPGIGSVPPGPPQ